MDALIPDTGIPLFNTTAFATPINSASNPVPPTTTAPTQPVSFSGDIASSIGGAAVSAVGGAIFSSRVIAILLGLLFVAGAFLLFASDEVFGALKNGDVVGAAKTLATT